MILSKRPKVKKHPPNKEIFFVYIARPNLSMNAGVRDWILPYKYVFLDIKDNGDFVMIPTNDESGYKLTITNGHAQFSCCGLLSQIDVKQKIRIMCEKQNDGTILCKASTVK